jgi:hypothetical protein
MYPQCRQTPARNSIRGGGKFVAGAETAKRWEAVGARVLAGDFVFRIFYFFAEGKNREELVAAGDAAKSGYAKRAPEAGAEAIGKFAGDALDFNIAADGAVSCEKVTERSRAGTEANGTAGTSPGNGTDNAGEVVEQCSSTRAAASCGMTNWTVHLA